MERALPITRVLAGGFALRLFGYGGAFLSGVTDGIKSGKHFSQGDTDAAMLYAGSAVTIAAGGSAVTYVSGALLAGATPALLTPAGWFILGGVLIAGSIALAFSAERAKDSEIERWLDACAFGRQGRRDAPTYAGLEEELSVLTHAIHTPKLIDSDWEDRWGWPDYRAEASVFLPGYDFASSHLKIRANGSSIGPDKQTREAGGALIEIRHYLPKESNKERVIFEISYRPNEHFNKDFVLHIILPEPE